MVSKLTRIQRLPHQRPVGPPPAPPSFGDLQAALAGPLEDLRLDGGGLQPVPSARLDEFQQVLDR
eukprot:4332751-Pyramimonas_sp.AAC.1